MQGTIYIHIGVTSVGDECACVQHDQLLKRMSTLLLLTFVSIV